ncbi:uncharacterized protein LOC128546127 [Mercenaria mercenaria]|uniref:uncharacterized protein LOC128546127 n=1 Tax=Mercenaria mercenaria TaxID=6596 RepID=UPI00234E830D|nr:uncharacterized protein LOC128546127 [Mercenaria mercenaria]
MAEERHLSQTVLGASEEIYDCNCSPCEESGVYKEAHKYCNSCKLYYCKKCLSEHNKFPALRRHLIKDVTSQPKQTVETGPSGVSTQATPTEPCEDHPEEIIKMYCGEHDVVCCTVCIALDHRECKDVHYILKLAKDIKTSQEYNDFADEMITIKTVYEDTQQSIQDEIKKMSNVKTEIIREIKEYKRELVSRIEELESRSLEKVNERYQQIIERLNATASHVSDLLDKVTNFVREIDNVGETQLFVQMKRTSPMRDEKRKIDKNLQTFEGLSFTLDNSIRNKIEHVDGLATAKVPVKILSKKEYGIIFDDDEYRRNNVRDMCILDDDTLVMTCNDRLKRLNRSFKKMSNVSVPGELNGICKTSRPNELAITIRDKQTIQFAQYTVNNMSLTKSFTVGVPCKGICCRDNYLFVACGGGGSDKVQGHLRQYDMQCNLICTIATDNTSRRIFTSPRLMALDSSTKKRIYSRQTQGIIVLDRNGKIERHLYNSFLKNGFSICITTRNKILISGLDSFSIHQYDENVRYVGSVLNLTEKMLEPEGILLDESKERLIVGMGVHNKIYVYEVEC